MKTTKIFSILAVLAFVLTGCQDDFGKKYGPVRVGDEIIFGGTSGYEPEGRTMYGDRTDTGTEIKWYVGDGVSIYCGQAQGDKKICEYSVNESGGTVSSLTAIGESGLKWGSEEATHYFYGVYPCPTQLKVNGADEQSKLASDKLELNGNALKGYLPNYQIPVAGNEYVRPDVNGNYTIHPAMRYAYMVATTSVNPSNENAYARLEFKPIVTAVEITLTNNSFNQEGTDEPEYYSIKNIKGFRIASDKVICGDFSATIDGKNNTVKAETSEDQYKQIYIPATIDSLQYGKTVKFTAFLMLADAAGDLSELDLTIITSSDQKHTKLSGISNDQNKEGIIVQAKKKNFLYNVNLNLGVINANKNASNWIQYIPNTDAKGEATYVRNLSIPGAGGAASGYKKSDGSYYITDNEYRQQNISIEEQWAQGIRCFEFTVDISESNMANEPVICNGKKTGVSLGEAVNKVKTALLASPNEFAMVIVTYQNTEGFVEITTQSRNPQLFMDRLSAFWSSLGDNWTATGEKMHTNTMGPALFASNLTIANARGKLFCIARPTSQYEDDYETAPKVDDVVENNSNYPTYDNSKLSVTNINSNILIINGWGSLKDKWQARGYTGCVFYRGKAGYGYSGQVTYAPLYNGSDKGRPFDTSSITPNSGNPPVATNYSANVAAKTSNFYYWTQAGTGSMVEKTAWVQEWARVSPADGVEAEFDDDDDNRSWYKAYWAPTIKEKELRIGETLNYAMTRYKGDIIYINSLCGYFVDKDITVSVVPNSNTDFSGTRSNRYGTESSFFTNYWKVKKLSANNPQAGMAGNIEAYATYINTYFYKLLQETNLTGGVGIVLMDRVSNDEVIDPNGYHIPQIIWNNNNFVNEKAKF